MPVVVVNNENQKILTSLGKQFFVNARLSDISNCDFDAKLAQKFALNCNKMTQNIINIVQIQQEAEVT